MSYTIITDTSANLPSAYLRRHDIEVIPFSYFYDSEEHTCLDTEAWDGEEYYSAIRKGLRVTTSQITPQRYEDRFRPILESGHDLLYIGMSSGISGAFHSSQIAARSLRTEFPDRRIEVLDTLGASLGEGLVVMLAVGYRDGGVSIDDAVLRLRELRRRICQIFTVDDLMFLRRSGRVSSVSAVVGSVLGIKPLLRGDEHGKIINYGTVRGRRRALRTLAEQFDETALHPERQTVGIAHAGVPDDAQELAELISRSVPPREILTVCYEPVTGAHVGPGTVALFFEGDEGVRLV